MSKKTVVLILAILVVVLASCSENPGTTTMKLNLSTHSESTGKTLQPSDSSLLDVSKYSVSGTGPNGKTFSLDSDSSSVTIEGLTIGDWTVTAKGKNSSGTELVTGSLTFKLTDKAATQTIVLDTLVGTGAFRFTVDWHYCDVSNPVVEAYLLGPDMGGSEYPLDITQNNDAKTATVSESLASGSYRLKMLLYDGDTQVAGLVEAVRISNGTTTEGSHTFLFNELGPNTITYITDATGTPIKGSLAIDGAPSTMVSDTDYSCTFSFSEPSKVNADGLTIEWYYDGNFMSTAELTTSGGSLAFTPKVGVHRIDAVVYNKKLGSTGSATCTFTVEPDGQAGELSLTIENAATALEITSQTKIGALPNDKFIVVTPDANKLYICSVHSSSISVEKTYTNKELSWLGDVKRMFSDKVSNFVLFTGDFVDSSESVICMYFDDSANTVAEKYRSKYIVNLKSRYFSDIVGAAFAGNNYIYVADAGSRFDFTLKLNGTEVSMGGVNTKAGSSYYAVSDIDASPNGIYSVSVFPSATSFVSSTMGSENVLIDPIISEANTVAGKYIRFANSQLVVVANNSSFTTYKYVKNAAYTKYKTFNTPVEDLEADGSNYFYVLDTANRIISYEASAYEITQLGAVDLPSKAQSNALTDGYFLVVMQDLKLNVYGIIK